MADIVRFQYNGGRVLVTIQQDAATQRTVKIGDYSKIITERLQTIDITNYQYWDYGDWSITQPRINGNAASLPSIKLDGTEYSAPTVWLPNAPKLYTYITMKSEWLSDLPYLLVTPNMLYGWTIGNASGGSIYYNGGDGRISNDTNIPDALAMCENWTAGIGAGTLLLWSSWLNRNISVPYISRPLGLNGVRLAWVNQYGAIDFWNFDFMRERKFGVETSRIYQNAQYDTGYTRLGTTAETTYTAESRELPQDILAALSYIIASPAVWWLTAGGGQTEIDIITDECRIFSDTELSTLQIEFRPKERDL